MLSHGRRRICFRRSHLSLEAPPGVAGLPPCQVELRRGGPAGALGAAQLELRTLRASRTT